jgi:putative redox protein
MSKTPERVTIKRISGAKFEGRNADGNVIVLDGPPSVGGVGQGVRPMQLVLIGLAGCSAVDVLHILQKGRLTLDDLEVQVEAVRADAVPAVFTDVHMRFVASGDFPDDRLQRAVELSVDKYCSVATMLQPDVKITWSAQKV